MEENKNKMKYIEVTVTLFKLYKVSIKVGIKNVGTLV